MAATADILRGLDLREGDTVVDLGSETVPQWWLHRCPELSGDDGQKAERALRRWLIRHQHAEVIGRSGDLPKPERLLLKLVNGCEQCNASGKAYTGGLYPHCDGRGTVWVVALAPDFEPSPEGVRAEVSRFSLVPF